MTRIAASEWMLENISAPLNLIVESPSGNRSYPVAVGRQVLEPGNTGSANVHVLQYGTSSTITSTDVRQVGVNFYFSLTRDEAGTDIITEGRLPILDNDQNQQQLIPFGDINLNPNETYYFNYRIQSSSEFSFSNIILRNVDENAPTLPVDLNLQSQTGALQGTLPVTPQEYLTLNRLQINDFQQIFMPSETTLKVSVYKDGDGEHPLAETSQTLVIFRAGASIIADF